MTYFSLFVVNLWSDEGCDVPIYFPSCTLAIFRDVGVLQVFPSVRDT